MPEIKVIIPSTLRRHFPMPPECSAAGESVADVINDLEKQYNGLSSYLLDERGALRTHVNLYIGENPVLDRTGLSDRISVNDTLYVLQALSGG